MDARTIVPRRTALLAALATALAASVAAPAAAAADDGAALFGQHCAACHGPAGAGVPGMAPALAGPLAPLFGSEDGRRYVRDVLLHGLSGRIVSQGQVFVGAMSPQARLGDAELAAIASHLAAGLNGHAEPGLAAEDFARARQARPSHKELRERRSRLMP